MCMHFFLYSIIQYRIAGNFCRSEFLRKSHSPSRRNFHGFNFAFSVSYWPCPFIIAGLMDDERRPVGEGRTLSVSLKRYSAIVRSSETSAQNARVKISPSSKVYAEVCLFKFSQFLFSCFDYGLRKLQKFGCHENFPLYGNWYQSIVGIDTYC